MGLARGELRVAVLVLDVLALALLGLELWRTPSPARLQVQRDLPSRVGLDVTFARVLRLRPGPAAGLELELRESFPDSFEVLGRTLEEDAPQELSPPAAGDPTGGPDRVLLDLDPEREQRIVRTYRGHRRGSYALGHVRLRLRSPWGFLQRQARLRGTQPLAVEPALAGLQRTLRLAASERWFDLGVRRLRRRGGMTEFESLRDYVHGDDVRFVDWKAFARRGKPTVRQFQVERGQELILLIDCGRRMGATTAEGSERGWTKLDHALDAALELAAVALQKGDRVGILAYDSGLRAWLPPRRGAQALPRLIEAVFDLAPAAVESDLSRALREVAIRHRRHALVAVLSDVADPLSVAEQEAALAHGGRTKRILFAALDDPSVRRVADGALPPGEEASPLRAAALQLVGDRRQALRRLGRGGTRVIDALPAESAGPLLAAWLDERRAARH